MTSNVTHLRANADIPPRDQRDWITTQELVAATCITYRRVDYWTRLGLLQAIDDNTPGTGFLRRYHESQLDRAVVLADLFLAGLDSHTVAGIVDQLLDEGRATVGDYVAIIIRRHTPTTSSGEQPA